MDAKAAAKSNNNACRQWGIVLALGQLGYFGRNDLQGTNLCMSWPHSTQIKAIDFSYLNCSRAI